MRITSNSDSKCLCRVPFQYLKISVMTLELLKPNNLVRGGRSKQMAQVRAALRSSQAISLKTKEVQARWTTGAAQGSSRARDAVCCFIPA